MSYSKRKQQKEKPKSNKKDMMLEIRVCEDFGCDPGPNDPNHRFLAPFSTLYPRPVGEDFLNEMRDRIREACEELGFSGRKTDALLDDLLGEGRERQVDEMERVTDVENYKARK